mgnify:CR=1 FL=1
MAISTARGAAATEVKPLVPHAHGASEGANREVKRIPEGKNQPKKKEGGKRKAIVIKNLPGVENATARFSHESKKPR